MFKPATVVDRDADGLGVVLAEPSSLQLLEGEAPPGPDLHVVLVGRAVDHGPQLPQGTGGHAGGLGDPGLAPPQLPGGLVEPRLDIVLPILVKVAIRDEVVSLGWHFF